MNDAPCPDNSTTSTSSPPASSETEKDIATGRSNPTYPKLGVLVLHGFTSSTDTVDGLLPLLENAGIDYERPVLRGHGTHYQDLRNVTAKDWYEDAKKALDSLASRVDRVVVVGLSMGGLVSLQLAMEHADKLAGVIVVAPALRVLDRLAPLAPLMSKVFRYWTSPNSFHDPECAKRCTNYPKFPMDAFVSLQRYAATIEQRLAEVSIPICILHSKVDQIIAPKSASIIYERVRSEHRKIVWFEKSGHEMMQDMEADTVLGEIITFIKSLRTKPIKETKPATSTYQDASSRA